MEDYFCFGMQLDKIFARMLQSSSRTDIISSVYLSLPVYQLLERLRVSLNMPPLCELQLYHADQWTCKWALYSKCEIVLEFFSPYELL